MNAPVKSLTAVGPSRRDVLAVSATVVAGSLVVGCSLPSLLSMGADDKFGPFGPFVRIAADGTVTVVSKHIEFGQGSSAGLAAILAEELDADWDKVKIVPAPANAKVYGNALAQGMQGTGGSSAVNDAWEQMRKVGAATRAMFVTAAATRWTVAPADLTVKNGVVSHPSGKSATFADLLPDAAKVAPPKDPPLKDPRTFTLVGTDRARRKDSLAKATGQARFTQDVHKPDMLTAMVAHAPLFGAKVKSFDATAAKAVPGVVDVFEIPSGVAVTANSTYAARKGREALKVEWDDAKAEKRSSDAILASYKDLASGKTAPTDKMKWQVFESHGAGPPPADGKVVEASFDFPYLAHAPMEPMNCVAEIGGGKNKLTFGSQVPTLDQLNTAMIVGALPGSVEIDTLFAGGSFGRRANFKSDYAVECVHIAKKVGGGRPVKLVWTREDDMTGGYYRPMVHHALKVTLGSDGYPAHWRHRIVTQSIMKGSPVGGGGLDESAVEGAKGSPYLKATPVVDGQVITAGLAGAGSLVALGGGDTYRLRHGAYGRSAGARRGQGPRGLPARPLRQGRRRPASGRAELCGRQGGPGAVRGMDPRRCGPRMLRLGRGPGGGGEAGGRGSQGRPGGDSHQLRHRHFARPDRRPDGGRNLLWPRVRAVRAGHAQGRRRFSRPTSTPIACCA